MRSKNRIVREPFTTTMDKALLEELRLTAVKEKRAYGHIIEDAVRELLVKKHSTK